MKRRLYMLIALVCLLGVVAFPVRADFGSYAGDSDYGGYDDYDYGGYDDYSWDWDYDDSDDSGWDWWGSDDSDDSDWDWWDSDEDDSWDWDNDSESYDSDSGGASESDVSWEDVWMSFMGLMEVIEEFSEWQEEQQPADVPETPRDGEETAPVGEPAETPPPEEPATGEDAADPEEDSAAVVTENEDSGTGGGGSTPGAGTERSADRTDGESCWGLALLGAAIFIAGCIWNRKGSGKRKKAAEPPPEPSAPPKQDRAKRERRPSGAKPASGLRPMEEYPWYDPDFDPEQMKTQLGDLYVQMQQAWTERDIEGLRPYFTDAFFTQMERQLNQMRRQGVINYVEHITVLGVTLKGFTRQGGEDHIIAELRTSILDYTLQEKTGRLVSGDSKREKYMTYEWDLCRAWDWQYGNRDGTEENVCPSCGAPLEGNAGIRCPYCGSVITRAKHDWALCAIKGLSQKTGR